VAKIGTHAVGAAVSVLAVSALWPVSCLGMTTSETFTRDELRVFLTESVSRDHQSPEFRFQPIDLNGDGQNEAIIYVNDRQFCGTGGCLLLVLRRDGPSFRVVGRTTITWPPIRVLNQRTNGWQDITVQVHGGGKTLGYEAVLKFDGRRYPSIPPARSANTSETGQELSSLGK
jgi:hypothetical protein